MASCPRRVKVGVPDARPVSIFTSARFFLSREMAAMICGRQMVGWVDGLFKKFLLTTDEALDSARADTSAKIGRRRRSRAST